MWEGGGIIYDNVWKYWWWLWRWRWRWRWWWWWRWWWGAGGGWGAVEDDEVEDDDVEDADGEDTDVEENEDEDDDVEEDGRMRMTMRMLRMLRRMRMRMRMRMVKRKMKWRRTRCRMKMLRRRKIMNMMMMMMMMMMMLRRMICCGRWGGGGWCCGRWGGRWWSWGWWCEGGGKWWCSEWWCWGGGRWWCWGWRCWGGGPIPRPRTTLCASLQSKCTSPFHKSHFIWKFTGKMPQPRLSPERGHTCCASLRSRNALQHFTNISQSHYIQEKCGAQSEHPDQAPDFTATVRTPQCGHTVRGKTVFIQQKFNMVWQCKFHQCLQTQFWAGEIPCPVATNGSTWGCSPRSKWLKHNHNTIVVGLRSAYISYPNLWGHD